MSLNIPFLPSVTGVLVHWVRLATSTFMSLNIPLLPSVTALILHWVYLASSTFMSLIPPVNSPYRSSKFDEQLFVDSVNNIGKAHRTRALQLISDCRLLIRTLESNPDTYARLRR